MKVDYGEPLSYGDFRGTFKTVSDIEHVKIVDAYLEGKNMQKLGKQLDRSSATIHGQITAHDEAIDRSGLCPRWRRAKGQHETERVKEK